LELGKETSSPARSSPSLLFLLGILVSSCALLRLFSKRQINQSNQFNHPQGSARDECRYVPPVIAEAEADTIGTHNFKHETYVRKTSNWEKAVTVAQVIIAFVTMGLLIVNWRQLTSNEEAFNLARRHTEDADEARLTIDGATIELRNNVYNFNLGNGGKSTARGVHAHIAFSENRLPALETIKVFDTRDISLDELEGNSDAPGHVILQGLGKKEWDEIEHTNESLVMNATIGYENGFGRPVTKKVCLAVVVDDRPKVARRVFMPRCEDIPDFLRRSTYKWFQMGKVPS
jgi:hypothetical protein